MKKISAVLVIGFFLFISKGFSQKSSVIEPDFLTVTYLKTTNLIFPYPIASVDGGSKDVLMRKAKNTDNILQLKARKKDFDETNLSIVTADGKFYSYVLNYEENPKVLNLQISGGKNESDDICLLSKSHNQEHLTKICKRLAAKKGFIHTKKNKRFGMKLQLQGIYIEEDILYYQISLQNETNINYDIDQFRFFIRDQKKSKRTASQEREITPLLVHNDTKTIEGKSEIIFVFAVPKFTIPDKKYLAIQVMEKSGGRNLKLKIKNRTIVKAKLIE